jgi:hypothetical protein
MSKDTKVTEADATEIIELAIDDIELLSRAFDVIAKVCDELNSDIDTEKEPAPVECEKIVLN